MSMVEVQIRLQKTENIFSIVDRQNPLKIKHFQGIYFFLPFLMQGARSISKTKNDSFSIGFLKAFFKNHCATRLFEELQKKISEIHHKGVNLRLIADAVAGSKTHHINAKKTAQQTVSGLLCRLRFD